MLTRQGWFVGVLAISLLAAGRLFGIFELFLLGTVAGVLLTIAAFVVGLTRLRLEVQRSLTPPRVHAGTPSRVEIAVRNKSSRRSPVLELRDPVSGTRGARLLVGPLEPLTTSRTAYRLPTERRGIVTIGPLAVVVTDPFGLTASAIEAADRTDLTVFPPVDALVPLPLTTGHDPHAGSDHPNSLSRGGEDFHSLRRYVVGDDLRRVHWPSTARHDDLMVRQDELPWQARTTILLDVRREAVSPDCLELVVSAAASVVTAGHRRRDLVRLTSTDGVDSGFAAGHAHVEAAMEYLATVKPVGAGTLRGMVDLLNRSAAGGALVAITSSLAAGEIAAIDRLRNRFGSATIVQFDRSSWDESAREPPDLPASTLRSIVVTRTQPFAAAWNQAVRTDRAGRRAG